MGNAAGKKLDKTELCVGTLHKGDNRTKSISDSLVSKDNGSTDNTTKIKSKGKSWVRYGKDVSETLLWTNKSKGGIIHSHTVIEDSNKKKIAIIIVDKKGMTSCTNYICRSVPSFDGQDPLCPKKLKKAGIDDTTEDDCTIYKFAKIVTNRKLTTAKCTYGIITGKNNDDNNNNNDDEKKEEEEFIIEPLYVGEKLSSVGFKAIFNEVRMTSTGDGGGGVPVAKAYMPGVSMNPHVDASTGVDLLAIVSMGYALAGDDTAAGALAGAGVY